MAVWVLHPAGQTVFVEATNEARAREAAAVIVLGAKKAKARPELWQRRAAPGGEVYDPMGTVRVATPAERRGWTKKIPLASELVGRDVAKSNPPRRKADPSRRKR